ncbi:SIMPL domain-containing protein [Candidatus Gottesmanbacteria bacterium]|nr:SIMPL domain-containing protein [Candidatus Gottesmanbacteria bacterium]
MENLKVKIIGLILGILVLFVGGWFVKTNYIDRPTLITVIGEGKVRATPETVKFTVTLANTAANATTAVSEIYRFVKEVFSLLKGSGVEEKDIIVSYVRVIPPTAALGQTNYQAINAIDVTLRNLASFDNLVNALYFLGAQSVSNIVFTTQDSKTLEKEAVAKAIEDAQGRVKEIAKASGKRVGRMVSIQTVEVGEAGALSGEAPRETGFGGQVSASPSQIEIVRQASIVFELR